MDPFGAPMAAPIAVMVAARGPLEATSEAAAPKMRFSSNLASLGIVSS